MRSPAPHIHIEIHGNAYQYFSNTPFDYAGGAASFPDGLGEIIRIKPEITFNNNRTTRNGRKAPDGIEIRFGNNKPVEAVRQELKDHGFQFSEKQTMWYAYDNEKSRSLAQRWMNEEVEADNTQYVKQHFWARVSSQEEYDQLRPYTEFFLKADPPKNFNGKRQLESSPYRLGEMMRQGLLFFKKHFNRAVEEEDDPATPYDATVIAQRLRELAQGMDKAIDEKINSATSRQRPTAKRMRVAAGMREEGRALQQVQTTLYALADAHSTAQIDQYPLLKAIRTKRQTDLLLKYGKYARNGWNVNEAYEHAKEELARVGINSLTQWEEASNQHHKLLEQHSDVTLHKQRQQQDRIKELEREIFRQDIPGFFPTPPELIQRMLEMAAIQPGNTVLEPSAGKGDILDAVKASFPDDQVTLYASEINSTLRSLLQVKGYKVLANDCFTLTAADGSFDRIVMNPPFENGQDADHVTHALKLLQPGGRLVAIVSEGLFFRKFKKETAFRELLAKMNAYVSEPIHEAFTKAFNPTGVNVRLVAINEDGTPINNSQRGQAAIVDEETALLELEAEAELELLKLRVEMERKRTGKPLEGIQEDKLRKYRLKAWALQNTTAVLDYK